MNSRSSTKPVGIGALANTITPRAVINIFHRYLTDAVIASYPKCGNTWLGTMLRHLIVDAYGLPASRMPKLFVNDYRPSEVLRVPYGIPLIYHNHFIVTTEGAEPHLGNMLDILSPFRRTPMLILFREPKDVIVSYYMEVVFREPVPRFEGTVDAFARSDIYGVTKLVSYYNALADFRRRSTGPTLLMRYEEIWADTFSSLKRAAEFLGIKHVTDERLHRAIEASSIENMRRMEAVATPETALVPSLHRPIRDLPDARRARVGGTGNWRKHLNTDTAAYIDAYVERHLDPLFRAAAVKD